MNPETYYRDHWVEIDPERLEAYESMFEWRPQMAPLLAPAEIGPGQTVVDYGCGPGGLAVELARRVAPDGRVQGLDLNADMVARARDRAAQEGLTERVEFTQVTDDRLPLEDATVDRIVCKNVLEYVTDVPALIGEFRRILRPGGRLHLIDSDWGLLAVEPLGDERVRSLFDAARHAYHTPHIGRQLYRHLRSARFDTVAVQVLCPADTKGYLAQVLFNMASYARGSGKLSDAAIDALLADVRQAITDQTFLLVLPQFLVTGSLEA